MIGVPVIIIFSIMTFALYSFICAIWGRLVLGMIIGPNHPLISFSIRDDDLTPYFYKDTRFYLPFLVGCFFVAASIWLHIEYGGFYKFLPAGLTILLLGVHFKVKSWMSKKQGN